MNEMKNFNQLLLNFFDVKKELQIPHLQNGRSGKINLSDIQIKKVKEIYYQDYVLLNNYFQI